MDLLDALTTKTKRSSVHTVKRWDMQSTAAGLNERIKSNLIGDCLKSIAA